MKKKAADAGGLKGFLKGKMSEDDYKTACDMMDPDDKPAKDEEEETEEEKAARLKKESNAEDEEENDEDETEEERTARLKKEARGDKKGRDKKAKDAEDPDDKKVTAKAMDSALSALKTTLQQTAKATREAERIVQPWVGQLAMDHDSPEDVYRTALGALNVKVDAAWNASVMRAILEAHPKPGARQQVTVMATDSKTMADYDTMFPDAKRIGGG